MKLTTFGDLKASAFSLPSSLSWPSETTFDDSDTINRHPRAALQALLLVAYMDVNLRIEIGSEIDIRGFRLKVCLIWQGKYYLIIRTWIPALAIGLARMTGYGWRILVSFPCKDLYLNICLSRRFDLRNHRIQAITSG